MAVTNNIHIDIRVIEVIDLNSEVKSDLRGHMEALIASRAMKNAFPGNMNMDFFVIEVTDLNSEVRYSPRM